MENQFCFDCLRSRIAGDFSDKLVFSYGISDSALALFSSAVVQTPSPGAEASPQFVLVYLPSSLDQCLRKYIDEYCQDDPQRDSDETPVSVTNQDQEDGLSSGGRRTSLAWFGCQSLSCNFSGKFSCSRTITSLAPIARIGVSSYPAFEEIASNYLSGFGEDHILCSVSLLIEGKSTTRDAINFLSLIGVPSFDDNKLPGCLRHPNIVPILGMMKASNYINLVFPKTPYTLESILHYSPGALKSEWHIKFLIYQLLSALAHMHGLGVAHGNICPSNVMLTDCCWSWLRIDDKPCLSANLSSTNKEGSLSPSLGIGCCVEGCPYSGVYADLKLSQSIDWHSAFTWWWRGELSNFEYLLVLNRLAGRRWGDHTFHPVLPWVVDFTVKPDETNDIGWRDLSKSKWRLAKGDEQLDFTYSTSEVPHHVSDECLSELAVCSYKARRLPLSVLRTAVRAVYEPNEYPSSMQRLYQWTPDECIPEFYFDPQIFYSLHSGMSDLAVPSWAGTPEQFIKLHRDALESNRVSREIHHWIDITFGYKMSGEAAILAKNVMLSASEPTMPRSAGRRQLFTQPHPARLVARKVHNRAAELSRHQHQANHSEGVKSLLLGTAHLQELEESAKFCEHARHLSPIYCYHPSALVENDFSTKQSLCEILEKKTSGTPNHISNHEVQSIIDLHYLLDNIEVDDDSYLGYQELLLWKQKSSCSKVLSGNIGKDIFSVGCILAELHLGRPLFDPTSLAMYLKGGVLPSVLQELPPHTKVLVGACIEKDSSRRPSAKCLLESPYFSATIRSSYLFLAPLQLLVKSELCLCYAANFAKQGAFKAMGPFAAEMCAPYCLPLVVNPLSDTEAEWAYIILKEFLKCLKSKAVKALILPAIQKILQATGYSHLKVSLLQDSFVREIWKQIGKQAYLETMHPLVILNLFAAPQKSSAAAAAVLLIGSSEELGVPVTVHQTILPLILCYGKGLCSDGIDVLVRIGGLLGEDFVVRQILPLLRNVVHSCIDASYMHKPEPMQSWSSLAIIDCLMTLDGLAAVLPKEVVIKELIEDGNCLHVKILMQTNLDVAALQVAATSLIAICEQIGPDLTALHVLPKLKELFYELAFSQETTIASGSFSRSSKVAKQKVEEVQIESRMGLVFLLYPPFAYLLGIEKLRQCCSTWLLLEQFLLRCHNWKWEYTGESTRSVPDNINAKRPGFNKRSTSEYTPAKLLLNGVGWSIPQSQGNRSGKNLIPHKHANDLHQNSGERPLGTSTFEKHDPWYWFPSPAASWDGPDFLGRAGSMKDELPWKVRASIIHSIRGHHGTIRSLAVCQDECTVFTAGVGPGFRGTVQKWDLSRIDCISGYYGHEEVVNDICVLSSCERVASCDGTVHVWNSQTGKLISIFTESSENPVHATSPPSTSTSKTNADHTNMLNSNPLSGGILSSAFDGSLYTCMHHLASIEKLVVGTGNGSLRFIDVSQGQKLHLWRSESGESSFPSLISSICACGPDKMQADGATTSPSWIAAGLSSGFCRLLDMRSGNIIASWRAHDGYVTKLAAPEEHLLVSSSLDKTLRVWDLRRNWPPQPIVFRGHNDGVSGFSVWGQDVISIAKNKIGLSSLSRSANENVQPRVTPQYLYLADRGARNVSVLSSLSILPFSRLFLVGTEDGHLKICC